MFRWQWQLVVFAVVCVSCGADPVWAQTSSSYADRELSRFRNQTVGDYSVERTIRSDLNSAQVSGLAGHVTQSSLPSRSFSDLGLSSPSIGKPFSSVTPSPTVSPYMNLFREDFSGESDLNYQTLVRPQLDQQRVNAQVQRQNMELSRRVQSISAQSNYGNPGGSQNQYPTGHPTSFRYYSHFYPTMGGRR